MIFASLTFSSYRHTNFLKTCSSN